MNNFTYSDFEKLSEEEARFYRLLEKENNGEMKSPSEHSVKNVLSYSKAISIRRSKEVDFIENVLN